MEILISLGERTCLRMRTGALFMPWRQIIFASCHVSVSVCGKKTLNEHYRNPGRTVNIVVFKHRR